MSNINPSIGFKYRYRKLRQRAAAPVGQVHVGTVGHHPYRHPRCCSGHAMGQSNQGVDRGADTPCWSDDEYTGATEPDDVSNDSGPEPTPNQGHLSEEGSSACGGGSPLTPLTPASVSSTNQDDSNIETSNSVLSPQGVKSPEFGCSPKRPQRPQSLFYPRIPIPDEDYIDIPLRSEVSPLHRHGHYDNNDASFLQQNWLPGSRRATPASSVESIPPPPK